MASTTPQYPSISLTNQSGVDVDIYDVFNPNTSPGGAYVYTRLGTISNGATSTIQTLRFASQLQAMYSGQVAAVNNTYYQQFPVAVFSVTPFAPAPQAATITADNRQAMEQAFLFIRYAQANASSKLTANFTAALNTQPDDSGSSADATPAPQPQTAVDAFFAATANFAQATYVAWAAVTSWQSQFVSAWQGPYYLYENDTASKSISLIAVVNVVSNATQNAATLYIANQNGTYSTTTSQNVLLESAGNGSLTESDVGQSPISATLTPAWMNISTVRNDGAVQYALGSAMSGTVNGIKVSGNGQQLQIASPTGGATQGSKAEDDAIKIVGLVSQGLGMVTSAGMLFMMFLQWKEAKAQKANETINRSPDPISDRPDIEMQIRRSDSALDDAQVPLLEARSAAVATEVAPLVSTTTAIVQTQSDTVAREVIGTQTESLQTLLEAAPPSTATETATGQLMEAEARLVAGDVGAAFTGVSQVSEAVAQLAQDASSGLTAEQTQAAEAARTDMEAATRTRDDLAEIKQQAQADADSDGANPVDDDDLTETADVDPPVVD